MKEWHKETGYANIASLILSVIPVVWGFSTGEIIYGMAYAFPGFLRSFTSIVILAYCCLILFPTTMTIFTGRRMFSRITIESVRSSNVSAGYGVIGIAVVLYGISLFEPGYPLTLNDLVYMIIWVVIGMLCIYSGKMYVALANESSS